MRGSRPEELSEKQFLFLEEAVERYLNGLESGEVINIDTLTDHIQTELNNLVGKDAALADSINKYLNKHSAMPGKRAVQRVKGLLPSFGNMIVKENNFRFFKR
ncbi:hypothetical protein [Bacillus cereus]|uniref:hypothetical protein n=1 Tax=Bacillus cereus TaxID=1396 RepID=UPI000BFBEFAA|nr:hypothetical protein [Bacillus cereus]PGW72614.1 hypothetical protein COE11_23205 [Bacillus cereus]